jgi:hypothetical protein
MKSMYVASRSRLPAAAVTSPIACHAGGESSFRPSSSSAVNVAYRGVRQTPPSKSSAGTLCAAAAATIRPG